MNKGGHLVLTRRPGESVQIKIGEHIFQVAVEAVTENLIGKEVRLGFIAPKEAQILRTEIAERIARQIQ